MSGVVPPPGAGTGHGGGLPDEAPALLWTAMAAAIALWWLWPWLHRAVKNPPQTCQKVQPPPDGQLSSGFVLGTKAANDSAACDENPAQQGDASAVQGDTGCAAAAASPTPATCGESAGLDFDPNNEFTEAFEDAAMLIEEALNLPPHGAEYAEATASLHRVATILDKLLEAWGTDEEFLKLAQLREASASFSKAFGGENHGSAAQHAARALLELGGFQRCEEQSGVLWVFQHQDPRARLDALTVRLCLRKHTDLQRLRGTLRWGQKNNEAVVPKLDGTSLVELFGLYRMRPLPPAATESPIDQASYREKCLEAAVRTKLNDRRAASPGAANWPQLALHEGLAGAARALAQAQRLRVRVANGDLTAASSGGSVDAEVRRLLTKLPLPPGFHAAHLHWNSDELPRLFGMSSSTGAGRAGTAHGGPNNNESSDRVAELLSNEAVGFWATRQSEDVLWPCAAIAGVGAALDYTVNRGFVVVILAGFEGHPMQGENGSVVTELLKPTRTRAGRNAAETAVAKTATGGLPSFGAKVRTMNGGDSIAHMYKK
eukprot:TRINITY_DN14663_c0_g1_i1.p1 TRINITY_DN14663_c0_g1~~TRINITY_DN14663_c0_g1_i1.p1  ORF type:complete len:546 (+),score=104.94 TRINITY_DN14663_c0_g1_i1:78-1715(+)